MERGAGLKVNAFAVESANAPRTANDNSFGNHGTVADLPSLFQLRRTDRRKLETDHHAGTLSASLIAASRTIYDIIGRDIEDDVGTVFSGTSVSTWVMAKTTTYTPTSKVASVEDGDLRTTTTTYDNDDRTNIVTDPIARQKQFLYDPVGNTILEIRALGTPLQENYASYTYAPDGEKTSVADADNPPGCMVTGSICHVTLYAYDGFNRLATTFFPDSSVAHPDIESLSYDLNSNILTRVNRAVQTLTYTYDVLNRQLTKIVPAYGSTAAETFTTAYDLGGRVDQAYDTVGDNVTSTYDTAGRQTATATTIAGISGALTASYTLDANSNRTKLAWPDGYYAGYCYDPLNRMSVAMANSTSSGCATNVLATYTYDPYSRRTNLAYGASASMAYSYTPAGDLTNLTDTQNGTANSVAFTLGYTNAHQLASEAFSNSAFVQNGSIMGTTAYAPVNVLNQYTNVTPVGASAITQSYDGNGNLTGDGTYTFAYDPENRLVSAAKSGLAAVYAYDPLGRREEKSGTGVTATVFLQDGSDEIAEYNTSGTLQRRFVPGPAIDDPIAMVPASGTTELFYTDHHGSVIATSDASGNLVEGPFSYDAYGDCYLGSSQATPCSTATSGEPFKYMGQYHDAETGCYYYRARYYCADPVRGGRFLQTDPVGYKDDLNLYAYVGNDPTDGIDPSGQVVISIGPSGDAYYIVGGGGGAGIYYDTETGQIGGYATVEGGTGIGLSAGGTLGVSKSMQTFQGWSSQARTGAGPVTGQVNMPHLDKPITGGSISAGVGLPFDFTISRSHTSAMCWFFCDHKDSAKPQKKKQPPPTGKSGTPVASVSPDVVNRQPWQPRSASQQGPAGITGNGPSGPHMCTGSRIGTTDSCTSF